MRSAITTIAVACSIAVAASCSGRIDRAADPETKPVGWIPPNYTLGGVVKVDGSSTVLPVSSRIAEAFRQQHPGVQIALNGSGTGSGFHQLCTGETDLIGASRPINRDEHQECDRHGIEFVELPFALDAVSVVINPRNSFVQCLSVVELKKMWEPAAAGTIRSWNQIRRGFPAQPLKLVGPGRQSGTFDYFTLAIVGQEGSSRADYLSSEDDAVLVNQIAADPDAIGYFGYGYYAANRDRLKLVAIDNGSGCVSPDPATVADDRYQPLTRPIFVYASKPALIRPEVGLLAQYYVAPENARFSLELGYLPLPRATLLSVARRLDIGTTGSRFGDRGSVLGVTVDTFEDEDRMRSALAR